MTDEPRPKKRGEPLDPYKQPPKRNTVLEQRLRDMAEALDVPYDPDEVVDDEFDDEDDDGEAG